MNTAKRFSSLAHGRRYALATTRYENCREKAFLRCRGAFQAGVGLVPQARSWIWQDAFVGTTQCRLSADQASSL